MSREIKKPRKKYLVQNPAQVIYLILVGITFMLAASILLLDLLAPAKADTKTVIVTQDQIYRDQIKGLYSSHIADIPVIDSSTTDEEVIRKYEEYKNLISITLQDIADLKVPAYYRSLHLDLVRMYTLMESSADSLLKNYYYTAGVGGYEIDEEAAARFEQKATEEYNIASYINDELTRKYSWLEI